MKLPTIFGGNQRRPSVISMFYTAFLDGENENSTGPDASSFPVIEPMRSTGDDSLMGGPQEEEGLHGGSNLADERNDVWII